MLWARRVRKAEHLGHITGGSITLDGQDVPVDDEAMRTSAGDLVGMIFQDPMTSAESDHDDR